MSSAVLFSGHSVKKSSKISLNQSCRSCKCAPCWCKIQCTVQLSMDRTPEGVTVISTVSAVCCSESSYGDQQGRQHWLDFFVNSSVCYNIYSNRERNSIIKKQEAPISIINRRRLKIKHVNEQNPSLMRNTVNIFRNLRQAIMCRRSVFIFSFHCS